MNDWLDASLKARPVVDDGFADRVIAVGRAQDRTHLLLRLLFAVLATGMVAAAIAGFALHTIERLGGDAAVFGIWKTPPPNEAAFVHDWRRFAEHPALVRRTDGESADARLAPIARRMADPVAGRPCRSNPVDDDCDTSFLVGLRQFSHLETLPPGVSGWTWSRIAQAHLARAAAVDGATFAAAVDDTRAFGRMLLGHDSDGAWLFHAVDFEIWMAGTRGQDTGGAKPLHFEMHRLRELWWEAPVFIGVEASPTTRALIADSRSAIACGARSDPHHTLDALIAFVDNDDHRALLRRVADNSNGCAARRPLPMRDLLCENPDGALCTLYVTTLQLPVIRGLVAPLLSPPPNHWKSRKM